MTIKKQRTLSAEYHFEGKGLHTGRHSHLTLKAAPADTGILFHRTDLGAGAFVEALAENVSNTSRSTTLTKEGVSVSTTEHLLSALTGLGVDNAIIEIDNLEVPILDGSARCYVDAISKDGLAEQDADRKYLDITEEIEVKDEKSGAWLKVVPADRPSADITVDFGSRILGVQKVHWDENVDYSTQISPCRTFVFFHELEFLLANNLVKGGDMDNAIVVVEHAVQPEQVERVATLFGVPRLDVHEGYLNNIRLHFPDECGRHKLLDLFGDLTLAGGFINGKITAYKPGHSINTRFADAIRKKMNEQ